MLIFIGKPYWKLTIDDPGRLFGSGIEQWKKKIMNFTSVTVGPTLMTFF